MKSVCLLVVAIATALAVPKEASTTTKATVTGGSESTTTKSSVTGGSNSTVAKSNVTEGSSTIPDNSPCKKWKKEDMAVASWKANQTHCLSFSATAVGLEKNETGTTGPAASKRKGKNMSVAAIAKAKAASKARLAKKTSNKSDGINEGTGKIPVDSPCKEKEEKDKKITYWKANATHCLEVVGVSANPPVLNPPKEVTKKGK